MSTNLNTFTLQSPGTLGLNTEKSDDVQDHRYSTEALNCVISKNGLLESRKGALATNAVAATGTPTLDVVFSYMEDDGTEHIISTGGNKIWVGTTTLTDKTGALTVTDDNWQFWNYKGEVFGYNGFNPPIYWDGGAGAFLTIASKGTAAGVVSSSVHLSAFGRSWVVDTTSPSTILYSDLLVPEDFSAGSSGSIDLNSVWTYSNDTITALAVHNNNLVIFGLRSIVIYASADDITNLALVEVINSNGCIARDSVQTVGNDIFYLANDGVRSLSRTVLQDNMPLGQISSPIRDEIINAANSATAIRSTYNEQQGFYLIQLGVVTYCCDVRLAEQGVFRWFKWDLPCYGLATSNSTDDELYFGMAGGFLAYYSGYLDLTDTYIMKYRSAWTDTGLNNSKAIWKRKTWYIESLNNISAVFTWGFDFLSQERTLAKSVTGIGASKYGSFVYGAAKYGGENTKQVLKANMSGTGSIIRLGFQTVIDGGKVAFNKIDTFMKTGRIR